METKAFKDYFKVSEPELQVTSYMNNWVSVSDELIRLTAQHANFYLTDIVYEINAISEDVEKGKNGASFEKSYVLVFRKNGVSKVTKDPESNGWLQQAYEDLRMLTIESDGDVVYITLDKVEFNRPEPTILIYTLDDGRKIYTSSYWSENDLASRVKEMLGMHPETDLKLEQVEKGKYAILIDEYNLGYLEQDCEVGLYA
jgi:hypothetical protein